MLSTHQNPQPVKEYFDAKLETRQIVEVEDEVMELVVSYLA